MRVLCKLGFHSFEVLPDDKKDLLWFEYGRCRRCKKEGFRLRNDIGITTILLEEENDEHPS